MLFHKGRSDISLNGGDNHERQVCKYNAHAGLIKVAKILNLVLIILFSWLHYNLEDFQPVFWILGSVSICFNLPITYFYICSKNERDVPLLILGFVFPSIVYMLLSIVSYDKMNPMITTFICIYVWHMIRA